MSAAERPSVAVIGLGAMGSGMAASLLRAGFAVTVFNRTAARAEPLAALGASVAASATDAFAAAPVVVLSLADEAAVTEVLFGAGSPPRGTTVVDTSTVSPTFARSAGERLSALGVDRVEACVIGNPPMAREGRLRILTAGDPAIAERVGPVLRACGQQVRHVGRSGLASTVKLAFNLLLGVQTAGLAEAVGLVEAAGLPRDVLLTALEHSGWRSPVLSFRAGYMAGHNYRPAGFRAELMRKDLDLACAEAAEHQVRLPVTERAAERFATVVRGGRGDEDAAVRPEFTAAAPVASR
ncbi:NAD(P)-dependent oxidoreductase [Actinoplanes siamensis]|uniref:NAD(P)-dependent oxidoreductase n=1 Tax=Actinoplanes siamensis TaxID=1223317 RepID=UPI00361F555A